MTPFLNEYISSGGGQQVTTLVKSNPTVEPLAGPQRVADIMERFPAAVYAQGPDTHLYKFLEALCGDAGAGLLRKQTYIARLRSEAEILSFKELDDFYTQHFKFKRIRPEIYDFDTDVQALTPEEWDDVRVKDDRYKHRAQTFFTATRHGNSPQGMALAAESGCGLECEVREHYKWIFDQYSDDKLGLGTLGQSDSVNEFIILPRLSAADGTLNDEYSYAKDMVPLTTITVTPAVHSVRPATLTRVQAASTKVWVTPTTLQDQGLTSGWYYLSPDIERNMLDVLDRLRPVGALMTTMGVPYRHMPIVPGTVSATSERIHVNRFVSGRPDVSWPAFSRSDAHFITGVGENESLSFAHMTIELPVVFHTIEGVSAYRDTALTDDFYNTPQFYAPPADVLSPPTTGTAVPSPTTAIAPIELHESAHYGSPSPQLQQIFPVLSTVSPNTGTPKENIVPKHNTPLILKAGGSK